MIFSDLQYLLSYDGGRYVLTALAGYLWMAGAAKLIRAMRP